MSSNSPKNSWISQHKKGISVSTWQPPLDPMFKLNFDAAIFLDLNYLGVGAIIRNGKGEVMAVMSVKGPL